MKIYHSVVLLRNKEEIAPLIFMPSLLILLMGLLIIFNPFNKYISIIRLISILMFGFVVLDAMNSFLYKRRAKNVLGLFK